MNALPEINLILTADGSHTLFSTEAGDHYHSTTGAITEALHVYIGAGLNRSSPVQSGLHLLEVGFGTGLNALLTFLNARQEIHYTAVEPHPLPASVVDSLNYPAWLGTGREVLKNMHSAGDSFLKISEKFNIRIIRDTLLGAVLDGPFTLVYYDCFSPAVQPALWTTDAFRKIASVVPPGGVLVTYSARGSVRRNLAAAGFAVEKLKGAPGKREMIRAVRT